MTIWGDGKRDQLEIIRDVMLAIKNPNGNNGHKITNKGKGGASKTKIVNRANLNFKTSGPYLDLLVRNGHIELNDGLYALTKAGETLLSSIMEIGKMIQ